MTETDDHECEIIRALTGTTTVYCGCGWAWSGFTPDTEHAMKQVRGHQEAHTDSTAHLTREQDGTIHIPTARDLAQRNQ